MLKFSKPFKRILLPRARVFCAPAPQLEKDTATEEIYQLFTKIIEVEKYNATRSKLTSHKPMGPLLQTLQSKFETREQIYESNFKAVQDTIKQDMMEKGNELKDDNDLIRVDINKTLEGQMVSGEFSLNGMTSEQRDKQCTAFLNICADEKKAISQIEKLEMEKAKLQIELEMEKAKPREEVEEIRKMFEMKEETRRELIEMMKENHEEEIANKNKTIESQKEQINQLNEMNDNLQSMRDFVLKLMMYGPGIIRECGKEFMDWFKK